jgi:hypothetical protein
VEESGGPGENHQPAAGHWQTLSHNVALSTPRHEPDSLVVVICTECTGSCKSNYYTMTTMTVPGFCGR